MSFNFVITLSSQLLDQTGSAETRLKAIKLLFQLPKISGTHPSEESVTSLLSQIALCAAEESPDSHKIQSYLTLIQTLLSFSPSPNSPDYRWILFIYCHSPIVVYEWAKAWQAGTVGAPKLATWLTQSWIRWRDEVKNGISNTDPRLALMDLGIRVARVAVAQLPVSSDAFEATVRLLICLYESEVRSGYC